MGGKALPLGSCVGTQWEGLEPLLTLCGVENVLAGPSAKPMQRPRDQPKSVFKRSHLAR